MRVRFLDLGKLRLEQVDTAVLSGDFINLAVPPKEASHALCGQFLREVGYSRKIGVW